MKFNEKLIELRKQYGLSQEALGYELNVTRQTISKWELGVSTPEMDKLVELSKYFNISLDVLINESINLNNPSSNTTSSNQPINPEFVGINSEYIPEDVKTKTYVSEPKKRTKAFYFAFMFLPFIIFVAIAIFMFTRFDNFTTSSVDAGNVYNFNNGLLHKQGIQDASSIQYLIEEIIPTSREVSFIYNDVVAKSEEQLLSLLQTFKNVDDVYAENYMVSFRYDNEGYINEITIEDIANKVPTLNNSINNTNKTDENNTSTSDSKEISYEIRVFNQALEIKKGTTSAFFIKNMFDDIIDKPKEVKEIVVVYNDIKADSKKEWLDLQEHFSNIRPSTSDNYVLSFEYADEGYINKVIIKDK